MTSRCGEESAAMKMPPDQIERERLRSNLDTSALCLAGAGAGKTYELVERMVAAVAEGAAPIEAVAAITFTRNAAAQLRSRFLARLLHERAAAEAPRTAMRLRAAASQVDRCFVGTLHAFCARLLRERPLEAGLAPGFDEVEEREELGMLRRGWDRFIEEQASDSDLLLTFDGLGLGLEPFYWFFVRRYQFSDVPLKPTRVAAPELRPVYERTLTQLREIERQIPRPLPAGADHLMQTLARLGHFLQYDGDLKEGERADLLAQVNSEFATSVTLYKWEPNQNYARLLKSDVLPQMRQEIEPVLRQWRQYVYMLAAGLIDDAVRSYETQRLGEGRLTFQDLLEHSAAMLRDHAEVRRYFQRRYRMLFIDEFQDTDPLQAEIAPYLTSADTTQGDWRQLAPRPGSLFVVGDEKQSIYRFRRADLEVFRLMRERIAAGAGEVVELNANFRSQGCLCEWLNGTFEKLLQGQDQRYQADFRPLLPVRPAGAEQNCVRVIRHEKTVGNARAVVAGDDAERIAGVIAAAVAGRTGPGSEDTPFAAASSAGDFMILTRTVAMLPLYARALQARGIPCLIVGAASLRQAPELAALVHMLDAVAQPENPVPIVAYLRGLLVGLGDDELYDYHKDGGRFDWDSEQPAEPTSDLRQRVAEAMERLRNLSQWLQQMTPAAAIERLFDASGLWRLRLPKDRRARATCFGCWRSSATGRHVWAGTGSTSWQSYTR